jgi:uncharacterized membrane protein YphA (DoxX/SURF4 family)
MALAAARRTYYPGFLGALFLVLLRTAIGWHFFYEGLTKIYSTPEGRSTFLAKIFPPPNSPPPMDKPDAPFSAEGYLRNSAGPLAPYFRGLVPDVDSLDKLDPEKLKTNWRDELERVATHYHFTEDQRKKAEESLRGREAIADDWFRDLENEQKIKQYKDDLANFLKLERDPTLLASERRNAYDERKKQESTRRELVAVVDGWTQTLRDSWRTLVKPEQAESYGRPPTPWRSIDWVNLTTMYGLTAVGFCLMLGLFTPLAALGGAAYLAMFYFSLPPWPGLPEAPMAEGHYLYVNKNLVELIACLALAATPNGLWIGLDALLFGWRARRRRASSEGPGGDEATDDHPRGPSEFRTTVPVTRRDRR